MSASCDLSSLLWALLAVPIGALTVVWALVAWLRPNSSLAQRFLANPYPTQEQADPISRFFGWTQEKNTPNITILRFLAPLIGSAFFVGGIFSLISQKACAARMPDWRSIFELQFTFWPPIIIFAAIAGLIGLMNVWRAGPIYRTLSVFCAVATGIAGGEAAAYHVGLQSQRWFTVAMLMVIILNFIFWLARKSIR